MRCEACDSENPDSAKFCGQCGAALTLKCPKCGLGNPGDFKFCGECGSPLSGSATEPAPVALAVVERGTGTAETRAEVAERRQLTVMFCDVVGSTSISERLDPEELREMMTLYQQLCVDKVQRFGGHVAKWLGDGVLVYFGFPTAHEDDARRAVHAGLSLIEALPDLNRRIQQALGSREGLDLHIRVGIHTGLVVAGEMGGGDFREVRAVVGEAPNVAARIQDLADPDTLLISAATYRLVQGRFHCLDRGPRVLRGLSREMKIYQVIQVTRRLRMSRDRCDGPSTAVVGRDSEKDILIDRWKRACEGQGQVVLLYGEAGIGKSYLMQFLQDYVSAGSRATLECRCSAYHGDSALYPIIDCLDRCLRSVDGSTSDGSSTNAKPQQLERFLRSYGLPLETGVPLFASLLSIPIPDGYDALDLTPERQRERTLDLFIELLEKMAVEKPLLFVFEDLHWVDPSTLELLNLLVDRPPNIPMLSLFTFRLEFNPAWVDQRHVTWVKLERLGSEDMEGVIRHVAGGKALPAEVLDLIVEKTDGVPLFLEELTKMVLESDMLCEEGGEYKLVGSLPSLTIPSTLQDSLMARLDGMQTAKQVAQQMATIGRDFSFGLARTLSPLDDAVLEQELNRLVDAELLIQTGELPDATYRFRHALIQDTAYQSLLHSTRQSYHREIARVLSEEFSSVAERQPELLAHHYTEGKLPMEAITSWQRAGARASGRSAYKEAARHFSKSIELLEFLPEGKERLQLELGIQVKLGLVLSTTRGYSSPEVEAAYKRALEICGDVGEDPRLLLPVLLGLWGFYVLRSELNTALDVAKRCDAIAQQTDNRDLQTRGSLCVGTVHFWMGDLLESRRLFEDIRALRRREAARAPALRSVQDPGVACRSWGALGLWLLGYAEEARERGAEAVTLSRELGDGFNVAFALYHCALLHQFRREVDTVEHLVEEGLALCKEHGFALYLGTGTVLKGWTLGQQGQGEEALAMIRQGLDVLRRTGTVLGMPQHFAMQAETYREGGQIDEAFGALDEAFACVEHGGERCYEADLHRIRGDLFLMGATTDVAAAESCYRKALEIAQSQSAKSLELRATVGLSRLQSTQGKGAEARDSLRQIYAWFTEGHETVDLRDAKALLDELQ